MIPSKHHMNQDWPAYNLLLLRNESQSDSHYVAISNTSILTRKGTAKNANHVFPACYYSTRSQEKIKEHMNLNCVSMVAGGSIVRCPDPENAVVKLKSTHKMCRISVCVTMDYEAILKREPRGEQVDKLTVVSYHIPSHCSLTVHIDDDWKDQFDKFHISAGTYDFDIVRNGGPHSGAPFWKGAIDLLIKIQNAYSRLLFKVSKQAVPFVHTREIEEMRQNATRCYICNAPFTTSDPAVVDHNHLTGEVRGIAHQSCNANYNLSHSFVPVFIHNMRGYDEKFLIPELATYHVGR
jgi:hypothetical protein